MQEPGSIEDSLRKRLVERGRSELRGRILAFPVILLVCCHQIWIALPPAGNDVLAHQVKLLKKLQNSADRRLSANQSPAEDLTLVHGIGPATAAHLVRIREFLGPFRRHQDLRLVPGIGINRLQQIEKQLTVDEK